MARSFKWGLGMNSCACGLHFIGVGKCPRCQREEALSTEVTKLKTHIKSVDSVLSQVVTTAESTESLEARCYVMRDLCRAALNLNREWGAK
jgi:hypothetical protein